MSSFFLPQAASKGRRGKDDRKRKKLKSHVKNKSKSFKNLKVEDKDDDIIDSDEEEKSDFLQSIRNNHIGLIDESYEETETAPEKRLRLAKEYIRQLEEENDGEDDNGDDDTIGDYVAKKLHDEVLEKAKRLHKKVADQYMTPGPDSIRFLRGHKLAVTSLVVMPDDHHVFTGSKDCSIIKWDIRTGSKDVVINGRRRGETGQTGHTGHVLALAITSDGKYLASGGTDCLIHIWDAVTCLHLHTFRGHKDSITGLVFQYGSHQLFSCSCDRTVKLWNVDEMAYIETLFGHQDGVMGIDCLSQERPVTAGASDRSVRIWKIIEESQLVYNDHSSGSIDAVKLIDERNFVSGSQDGSIALWNVAKKKPSVVVNHSQCGEWVTTVTTLPYTDMIASGSSDGHVHIWKCGEFNKSLEHTFSIPVNGFVNSLSFTGDGNYLLGAIGQEHRLGRWWKDSTVKNGIIIITLNKII